MRAERFGSYSMPATLAGMPSFSRRKSTSRSIRLAPPPRCRTVMRPWTLRPLLRLPLVRSRLFSGVFLVISSLVRKVMYRRAGEVGLSVRIPMGLGALHELDLVTRSQRDHRLLPAPATPLEPAHALPLALAGLGAHVGHLHVEDLLHRVADLHLVGVHRDLEGDRVQLFLLLHALLGHQRTHQHRPGISHARGLREVLDGVLLAVGAFAFRGAFAFPVPAGAGAAPAPSGCSVRSSVCNAAFSNSTRSWRMIW